MKAHHGKNMRVSADVDVRGQPGVSGAPLYLDDRSDGMCLKGQSCSPIRMKNIKRLYPSALKLSSRLTEQAQPMKTKPPQCRLRILHRTES